MKHKTILLVFFLAVIFSACKKNLQQPGSGGPVPTPPPPPPPPVAVDCSNRDVVTANLTQVGSLSIARIGMVGGTVGSKILFAGGMEVGAYSPRVDIYDTITHNWSTAQLSVTARQGMAVATVGTKIFFAGGEDADMGDLTSRIDIYDAATNNWSRAELSQPKAFLAAVTFGNKIYFAGGGSWGPLSPGGSQYYFVGQKSIDIYDNQTDSWSTNNLSEGRYELSATVSGNKIYFAGGLTSIYGISSTIDILDVPSNTWSVAYLHEPKTNHAAIAADEKIFWAGGARKPYWMGYTLSDKTEILDVTTGSTSFECIKPRTMFNSVKKDKLLVFFTGNLGQDPSSATQFEIYNIDTKKWSTAIINKPINDATVISVNNTIYIAGGRSGAWGPYFTEVWKLDF